MRMVECKSGGSTRQTRASFGRVNFFLFTCLLAYARIPVSSREPPPLYIIVLRPMSS